MSDCFPTVPVIPNSCTHHKIRCPMEHFHFEEAHIATPPCANVILSADHTEDDLSCNADPCASTQSLCLSPFYKGTLLGTPNREPQEYSRYIIGIYLPGSLCSIIFLLYSWGSLFGVPYLGFPVESLYSPVRGIRHPKHLL